MIVPKNPIQIADDRVYIALPNTQPLMHATGSVVDLALIQQHRWRFIQGRVVTTVNEHGTEVQIPFGNLLLGRTRRERIPHLDRNPLNCLSTNLGVPRMQGIPNTITVAGDVAHIAMGDGEPPVIIDAADAPRCAPYAWKLLRRHRVTGPPLLSIRATYVLPDGKRVNVLLPRFILDLPKHSLLTVTPLNGDVLDCRRRNLVVANESDTPAGGAALDALPNEWFTYAERLGIPELEPHDARSPDDDQPGAPVNPKGGRPGRLYAGFVSPTGEVYTDITSLTAFSKQHKLSYQGLYMLATGKQPQYKGWTRLPANTEDTACK